jgi:biopolymer transport protein ExbB
LHRLGATKQAQLLRVKAAEMRSILEWYRDGGPFIAPLLVVTGVALALLVERISYIVVRSKIHARPFIERVITLARTGKVDEALKLCAEHQSLLPDVGIIILRSRSADAAGLLNVAEAAELTVVPALTRRIGWLRTLAWIIVLLGVLGAIANLHAALIQAPVGADASRALREGIAYALRPLGAGVLGALPLVAGHAFLVNETEKLVAELEEFSVRLVNALVDRPDVRLGHRT